MKAENLFFSYIDGLIAGLQIAFCLIFFVFFSGKITKSYKNIYLAWLFPTLAAFFIMSNIWYFSRTSVVISIFPFSLPVFLTILPLFALYFDSLMQHDINKNIKRLSHFAPSLILFILLLPFYLMNESDKTHFISGKHISSTGLLFNFIKKLYEIGVYAILNTQFIFYTARFILKYRRYKTKIAQLYSFKDDIDLKNIINIVFIFLLFLFLLNSSRFLGIKYHSELRIVFHSVISILILIFGFKALKLNLFFSESLQKKLIESPETGVNDEYLRSERYKNSNLTIDKKMEIKIGINNLLTSGIYKNPTLSLEHFAEQIGTNSTYLSQVINEDYKKNFYTLINEYRIEEAKKMLVSADKDRYTLEAVSRMCGFRSKSSFNNSFKKLTEMTPRDFKKQHG